MYKYSLKLKLWSKTTRERGREEEREKIHQILPRKGIAPKSLFFRALYFLSYLGFVNFGVLEFFIEWNVERLGSNQILKTLTLKNYTKR